MHWTGRSQGGYLLPLLLFKLLHLLGFRSTRLVALVIAGPWLWLAPRTRAGMRAYWRRLRPDLDAGSHLGLMWRHLASYGAILADRLLVYRRGHQVRLAQRGWQEVGDCLAAGRGVILLSAHVGNWELAGRLFSRFHAGHRVHLVKVENESQQEQDFKRHLGDKAPTIIDPRDPIAAMLQIRAALTAGEVVCMLGDRLYPGQPSLTVEFLGSPVAIPLGPFQVAAATGAPLIMCAVMTPRPGLYRYEGLPARILQPPARRSQRREVLQEAADDWTKFLQGLCRRYPLQWHNFFDLWRAQPPDRRGR